MRLSAVPIAVFIGLLFVTTHALGSTENATDQETRNIRELYVEIKPILHLLNVLSGYLTEAQSMAEDDVSQEPNAMLEKDAVLTQMMEHLFQKLGLTLMEDQPSTSSPGRGTGEDLLWWFLNLGATEALPRFYKEVAESRARRDVGARPRHLALRTFEVQLAEIRNNSSDGPPVVKFDLVQKNVDSTQSVVNSSRVDRAPRPAGVFFGGRDPVLEKMLWDAYHNLSTNVLLLDQILERKLGCRLGGEKLLQMIFLSPISLKDLEEACSLEAVDEERRRRVYRTPGNYPDHFQADSAFAFPQAPMALLGEVFEKPESDLKASSSVSFPSFASAISAMTSEQSLEMDMPVTSTGATPQAFDATEPIMWESARTPATVEPVVWHSPGTFTTAEPVTRPSPHTTTMAEGSPSRETPRTFERGDLGHSWESSIATNEAGSPGAISSYSRGTASGGGSKEPDLEANLKEAKYLNARTSSSKMETTSERTRPAEAVEDDSKTGGAAIPGYDPYKYDTTAISRMSKEDRETLFPLLKPQADLEASGSGDTEMTQPAETTRPTEITRPAETIQPAEVDAKEVHVDQPRDRDIHQMLVIAMGTILGLATLLLVSLAVFKRSRHRTGSFDMDATVPPSGKKEGIPLQENA
ncbi:unnamed protein product [Darwinula stevensoni]|uniref:Uncharacterized protein n=1 Tax=Darwinula stevensoni TaxID=69355 RepID=A0A7R9A8F6_9CRUS|nr:unnamed protein product [Darwinula stevensoni]CAG0896323.1 unnamed protein product [Darwinula stevensoni]